MDDTREQAMKFVAPVLDQMAVTPGVWYIASPYAKYPTGKAEAWKGIVRLSAAFLKAGLNIYSPVAHWHPISVAAKAAGGLPTNPTFWHEVNKPQQDKCVGLVVMQMKGWDLSEGIKLDQIEFELSDKPVLFMPVPDDFDPEASRLHAAYSSRHVRR